MMEKEQNGKHPDRTYPVPGSGDDIQQEGIPEDI